MTKQIKVNKEIHGMLVLLKKETKSASINDAIEILLETYYRYKDAKIVKVVEINEVKK